MSRLLGIDVSNHQGLIDWSGPAQFDRHYAFIKASEGNWFLDKWCERNRDGAAASGLVVGLYHFARPSACSPEQEVSWFQSCVGIVRSGELVALDMEDQHVPWDRDLAQWVDEWCDLALRALKLRTVVLYSGDWYARPHGLLNPALDRWPKWWAEYDLTPSPTPHLFWQFTGHGRVPGVSGDCDENIFYGTLDELRALGT